MLNPENIPTADLIEMTDQFFSEGSIDDPANIAGDKVYIFQGTVDDVVVPGGSPNIVFDFNILIFVFIFYCKSRITNQ